MPDPTLPLPPVARVPPLEFSAPGGDDVDICDRCRAQMFRERAAWHCPGCGLRTDGYTW